MKRIREWISIRIAKTPGAMVLLGIVVGNVFLFLITATIISYLAPLSLANRGFWSSLYYTVAMVLDAGCIEFVIQDIGDATVALILVCLATILLGMIIFTGAVIGYVSNWISNFIDKANSGASKLNLSKHTVILNWNNRASEIINDMMYTGKKDVIVVLIAKDKDSVKREIDERLADTVEKERKAGVKIKNQLTVLVREGDTYSTKQLNDICLSQAKNVIILGNDISDALCKFDFKERIDRLDKGNANTVKTLVQVAQITAAEDSADSQQIVVEVDDDWTLSLVNRIVEHKMRQGKCNIVPVAVNRILGQILSQFCIMPELNTVYSTLFSNKDASFFVQSGVEVQEEATFIEQYLFTHKHAIPLTVMKDESGLFNNYFVASKETDIIEHCNEDQGGLYEVDLNPNYQFDQKHVVILGHNSKCNAIMEGFDSFICEWGDNEREVLDIIVIDDKKSLEKLNYYKDFPYIKNVIAANVFDKDIICEAINEFVDKNSSDTSVLILSDDTVADEEVDANALTYLIYLQDIVSNHIAHNPKFDRESIDIVVEIINPKNYDVVHHYSVNNIVISNRYISKMIIQIAEKKSLFDFYNDILSYDAEGADQYSSKELYIKQVDHFFKNIPAPCTAAELIRAVYSASPAHNKTIVIGYTGPNEKIVIFEGNQDKIKVELTKRDKLILFSNH
ncbi:MAG TPA: hypothetical protein VFD23_03270 [Clostridia bacterium]|nr:hypothetical protein [Clostridia bacterium]